MKKQGTRGAERKQVNADSLKISAWPARNRHESCGRIDGARGISRFFLSSCITGDDVARHCSVSRFPRSIHFLNHHR